MSLCIKQSEKRSRTVSLWIIQCEQVPCQRVRKRDKPAKKELKKNRVNVCRKRDKPDLYLFCYFGSGETFCLTMMYLMKKFRESQSKFSRNSRKISLQSKRISRKKSDSCCIVERRESVQRKKKNFSSRTKLCCF